MTEQDKQPENPFEGISKSDEEKKAENPFETFTGESHGKKFLKMQQTTVKEAREQLADMKDGDTFVWGTRVTVGLKEGLQQQLMAMNDDDSLVWGTRTS
jgi:hypothetical protein